MCTWLLRSQLAKCACALAAGVVEQFTEKPGRDALRELTKGSKYSSEAQPFEVCSTLSCGILP